VKYYRAKAIIQGSRTVWADLAAGGIQVQPITQVHHCQIMGGWKTLIERTKMFKPTPEFIYKFISLTTIVIKSSFYLYFN